MTICIKKKDLERATSLYEHIKETADKLDITYLEFLQLFFIEPRTTEEYIDLLTTVNLNWRHSQKNGLENTSLGHMLKYRTKAVARGLANWLDVESRNTEIEKMIQRGVFNL